MRLLAVITALALALSLVLGGLEPIGRVLLAVGQPALAERALSDPRWRGVALYRAGRFEDAAHAFGTAGAFYNQGNALAYAGNYAAALEAYDIALSRGDAQAGANFDVLAAYYAGMGIDPEALGLFSKRKDGPQMDSHIAEGNARAAGAGDAVTNTNSLLGLIELESRGRLGVRRIFDDKFMVADERWLAQLSDVPGEFLKARISHEFKRRTKAGIAPPDLEEAE